MTQVEKILYDIYRKLYISILTPTSFRTLTSNNTSQTIKGSKGNLLGWNIINLTATDIYVKFYDKVTSTSADTPSKTLIIPGNSSIYLENSGNSQLDFSTALSLRCVTGYLDNDNTSPATSPIIEILVN